MSAAEKHLKAVRSALKDGPLSPAELRAATGLSRHQIGRAADLSSVESSVDREIPLICYSAQHHLWIETNNGFEIGRSLLPALKGQVTRCSRTIGMIEFGMRATGAQDDPDFLRSLKICEAHRQQALDQIEAIEAVLANAR